MADSISVRADTRPMDANRFWSLEDCCWVEAPAEEVVPAQREDKIVQEAVDARAATPPSVSTLQA